MHAKRGWDLRLPYEENSQSNIRKKCSPPHGREHNVLRSGLILLLALEQENDQEQKSQNTENGAHEHRSVRIEDNQLILRNSNSIEEFVVFISQSISIHGTVIADDLHLVVQSLRNSEGSLAVVLFQILQEILTRHVKPDTDRIPCFPSTIFSFSDVFASSGQDISLLPCD